MAVKKYLDLVGLGTYHGQLKTKWFDKLDAVVNDSSQIINTTVLSGTPTASGTGNTLANTDVVASTKWVLNEISGITEPMIFKGSVSISGTTLTFDDGIEEIKTGYTFKFTEAAEDFKAGDVIIAKTAVTVDTTGAHPTATYDADEWTVVPAGDDVDVTAVTAGTGLSATLPSGQSGSTITTTGTINLEPATASTIGGVKVAAVGTSNITLAGDGGISVATATDGTLGLVKPDGTTLKVNGTSGNLEVQPATASVLGGVKDGNYVTIAQDGTISADIATASTPGVVSPDGVVITVDGSGNITVPDATNNVKGVVTVDNTSITASNGVITAVTATAGTSADGTKGIVTTASNSSALSITSGSIAVKLKSETISDVATTSLGIDSDGLFVDVITTADITNIVTPA